LYHRILLYYFLMLIPLRYLIALIYIGLTLLRPSIGIAQQLSKEPAGGMDEYAVEEISRAFPPSVTPLPAALNYYPLNSFYHSWDTLSVRRYSDPAVMITDSIMLPLILGGKGTFVFPRNGQLLSPFGYRGRRMHAGVDIKLDLYDTVRAAFDGVVRMARYYAGYGNCVVIRHYNGLETLYGHLSKIKVCVNQPISAGEMVGLGGHTGRASCNHLHFETRFKGQAFNPKQLIDFNSFSLMCDTLVITDRTFGRSRDYMPQNNELIASADSRTDYKARNPSGSKKYHTIKSGDTLYAISRKYNTTVKQLCALNGIKPAKLLQLGTRIRVK
jgi:murein DD-endopeptidase MepM/ murein hydrolase activator NlpD